MQFFEKIPVNIVMSLRRLFGCKTYHIEGAFVLITLIAVAEYSGKGLVEYVGVAAVFFTFMHATIAEYMREAEALREKETNQIITACHKKLPYYFYAKEICWLIYFIWLGAYSALVGVAVFLLYQPWRRLWRKYHPM